MSITAKTAPKRQIIWSPGFAMGENGAIASLVNDAKPLECVPS